MAQRPSPPSSKSSSSGRFAGSTSIGRQRGRSTGLKACPFCRELFVDEETDACPECGIGLRDLASLPPSPDAEALMHEEAGTRGFAAPIPQSEPIPWRDFSRGRGVLIVCALLGIGAFYAPWAYQSLPHTQQWSGVDFAHTRAFFWATFVAWFVLVPAVLSRRTQLQMVGARVACAMLSAIPAIQCGFILLRPTHIVLRGVPFDYELRGGVYATLAISIVATLVSLRFGGAIDDVMTHGAHARPRRRERGR